MKYLSLFLIAIMPLSLSAEKKVSKIHRIVEDYPDPPDIETEFLTYDENGRLASWKVVDDRGRAWFDQTIEYVSKDKVVISGIFDGDQGVMEVSLDENGLATSAYLDIDGGDDTGIFLSYQNGLMSKITWHDYFNGSEDVTDFEITDGNPTRLISDHWGRDYPIITYSDKPNKCGLVYLPMITCNSAWAFRAVAYAGLQGYGSINLPYSSNFFPDEDPDHVIDYVIDDEGYVTSMNIENGNDGNGHYTFEYCEVNGVDDIETATVEVSGGKNSIIVKGEYDSIKVYNLSGMLCNATSGLAPGIYIVDVDNAKFKVRVY